MLVVPQGARNQPVANPITSAHEPKAADEDNWERVAHLVPPEPCEFPLMQEAGARQLRLATKRRHSTPGSSARRGVGQSGQRSHGRDNIFSASTLGPTARSRISVRMTSRMRISSNIDCP